MKIECYCEGCGHKYIFPQEYMGKKVRCKKCDHIIIIKPAGQVNKDSEEKVRCPFCDGEISLSAAKCKHCGEFLVGVDSMPVGRQTMKRSSGSYKDVTFFDRVLLFTFRFAKGISAIIVILCLLTGVIGIMGMFFISTNLRNEKLDVPEFSEYLKLIEQKRQSQRNNKQATSNKNGSDLFKSATWEEYIGRFNRLINGVCKDFNLNESQLRVWVSDIDSEHRETFISGLSSFLCDSKKHFEGKVGGKTNYTKIAGYYRLMFDNRMDRLEALKRHNASERIRISVNRRILLIAVALSLGLLLAFLILPLLIQIEHNTRTLTVS